MSGLSSMNVEILVEVIVMLCTKLDSLEADSSQPIVHGDAGLDANQQIIFLSFKFVRQPIRCLC